MRRLKAFHLSLLIGLFGVLVIAPARARSAEDPLLERFQRMVRYNLDNSEVVESERLNAALTHLGHLPLGERVAAWASWFLDLGRVEYVFGLDADGYVRQGRLVQDYATDCVLFMYRVTELARSTTAEEAVQFAFGTRFYGASVEKAVDDAGRVDYDDPAHLEYSEDMIQSAIWGKDVTASLGAATESLGEVSFIPRDQIPYDALRTGDIVWFVGPQVCAPDGKSDGRDTQIHHIGIIDRRNGRTELLHAALKPLPGLYESNGLVRVGLDQYLGRIDRFRGIVVTRLNEF